MNVTVIIPTYNRPGYLAQAVFSVLQQTHPVFEIIIVDDGSSELNRNKIEALKKWDDRISIFHFHENKGVSAARNYGLEMSKGDFILFLDDDDLLKPHMVESNLKIFAADRKTDVVSSGYSMFFDINKPDADWKKGDLDSLFPEKILVSWDYGEISLLTERPFSALLQKSLQVSSCLLRRESIGSTRFPEDLPLGEDTFFWLILANAGCTFRINHTQLGFYRLHRYNSLSGPGCLAASLKSKLKLFDTGIITTPYDSFIIHVSIARLLFKLDQVQCLKHILLACRNLVSFQMISHWPMMLKSMPAKIKIKFKNRKVRKAFRSIRSSKAYGNRG